MKTTIPSDVWETKRAQISNLYTEEEWPLKQVMKKIRTEDFNPTETQLRSRLKKWGVTKPSRQRRKRPASRPTERGGQLSLSPAQEVELRSRANESYPPQFLGYPHPAGQPVHPESWDTRVRWIMAPSHNHAHQLKVVPCCDGRRASASSNASLVEGPCQSPIGYSDYHHHHHTHPTNRQYPNASPTQGSSSSIESCSAQAFSGINPNLTTSSGDITPTSDAASGGLPAGWQSPDSTHHAVRTPGSTLPSPAIQPTSPWSYPTPDMCQRCSPTIYPLDDSSVEQQVNYVKEYLNSEENLSYPSVLDLPLNDGEILDSFSVKAWKRPSSSGEGSVQFSCAGDVSPSRGCQNAKSQPPVTSAACTTVVTSPSILALTNGYPKIESPGPLDISAIGGTTDSMGLASHQPYASDAISNEYLLASAILS
ncbi:hypothetical protein MGYG_05919 [Nannizzia gypsea CBS 118893]|uniref:Clr5 domain-containing protein n=1 Tax=Arthroderma gypseum (strain ATCC MYA-4604 / CBS 118893) TaxID=535722 RepID=E4UZY0_ARTGP|nr:hypothetical protein MGYG_05919 [Nannizzia gypsea CBS 118893]EFR02917.1 hypothetical protein MGYG_05919 [Nannizzia gypsea CBS 118893]